jgi:Tfp pilus assembly protein PilP
MRRRLAALLVLAGALGSADAGRAQAPAAGAAGTAAGTDGTPRPGAPNLGAVKDTVKDAMKDVLKGVAPAKPAAAAVAPAPTPTDPASRAAALRHKTLREDDFVDSDATNRDPFKSFLRFFVDKRAPQVRAVPAVFEKFALEELTLIAIVSGDTMPRAMFRDPGGLGQTVKRGDYLSKAGARVTKILSDRVILEFSDPSGNPEARALEKAVLVRPEEEAAK